MKKINKISMILLLFVVMAGLSIAAVPFESIVQKNAQAKGRAPFEGLASNQGPVAPFSNFPKENPALSLEPQVKQPSLSWVYVAFPIFIVAGMLTYFEAKRRKDHIKLMAQAKEYKTDSLKNYVQTNVKKGFAKQDIRNALIKNNYASMEIEDAFKGIK